MPPRRTDPHRCTSADTSRARSYFRSCRRLRRSSTSFRPRRASMDTGEPPRPRARWVPLRPQAARHPARRRHRSHRAPATRWIPRSAQGRRRARSLPPRPPTARWSLHPCRERARGHRGRGSAHNLRAMRLRPRRLRSAPRSRRAGPSGGLRPRSSSESAARAGSTEGASAAKQGPYVTGLQSREGAAGDTRGQSPKPTSNYTLRNGNRVE